MYIGITEQQKVGKQGRDDSIKQLSIQTPDISLSWYTYSYIWKKATEEEFVYLNVILSFLPFSFFPFCCPYIISYL